MQLESDSYFCNYQYSAEISLQDKRNHFKQRRTTEPLFGQRLYGNAGISYEQAVYK